MAVRARRITRMFVNVLRRWFRRKRAQGRSTPPNTKAVSHSQARPAGQAASQSRVKPGTQDSTRTPVSQLSAEDSRLLERLISQAWKFPKLPSAPFTLELRSRNPEDVLKAIYSHARVRTPGLDIPYSLPRLRFKKNSRAPSGSFSVSEDGWTTIEVDWFLKGQWDWPAF